jgi:COP9 signalosome complex subunit 2|tara:strand:+ start:7873 stop:9120 length:1248 start_codon:yes stop_codon:yes gene_type:complete
LLEDGARENALEAFAEVISMEREKGEWGFKALKQIVKLLYKMGDAEKMLERYKELLTYVNDAVTRNYSEKVLNSILDDIGTNEDMGFLQEFYETTLKKLEETKNERLWFKTNLKLCALLFDAKEFPQMQLILRELHKSCQNEDGTLDQRKGTQLLEVYSIEIQMYTAQKNTKKLKDLYVKALQVTSAIPHPRISGVIRECGGKMYMTERQWELAATDFFEAFKSYDEAGSERRVQCLKYLVLANMLMESAVDPFDAQEVKPYRDDPDVTAMRALVGAYQRNDITTFERLLSAHRAQVMGDDFVRDSIEDLLKNIRTQVLLNLIKPYTTITIPHISTELNIPEDDVEALVVALILDGRVDARVDQLARVVRIRRPPGADARVDPRAERARGLARWAARLRRLHAAVSGRLVSNPRA